MTANVLEKIFGEVKIQPMQRGHIRKHHGAWTLFYWDWDLRGGQRLRVQRSKRLAPVDDHYRKISDVRLMADKFLEPINSKYVQPESSMQLVDFIENFYLPWVKSERRPSTYKDYKKDIFEKHLKSRLGKLHLRDFRTVHGQKILRTIPGIGHKTLLRIKSFLSGVFNHAKREGFIDGSNPMQGVSAPGSPRKFVGPAYTLDEIRAMMNILTFPPEDVAVAKTSLMTAALTGLRVSELRGLRWDDYDGENLFVRRSIWRTHTNLPKNPASEDAVPVVPFLRSILDTYRKRLKNPHTTYIFEGTKRPVPLNLNNFVNRIIKPELVKNGIKWKGWHAFRRGLASNLIALGTEPKVVQNIMRHSDIHTTMQIYVQAPDEKSREAIKKIEDALAF